MCESKFDVNKPVQTRDGRKARIICADRKFDKWSIVALVEGVQGEEVVLRDKDGLSLSGRSNPSDLINIPEEKVTYHSVGLDSLNCLILGGSWPHTIKGVKNQLKVTVVDGDIKDVCLIKQ